MGENYFSREEEDVLHDAFAMIHSELSEHENIEDVMVNETTYEKENLDAYIEMIEDRNKDEE